MTQRSGYFLSKSKNLAMKRKSLSNLDGATDKQFYTMGDKAKHSNCSANCEILFIVFRSLFCGIKIHKLLPSTLTAIRCKTIVFIHRTSHGYPDTERD